MTKLLKILCAVTLLTMLAACNSGVTSQVSRFHMLPAPQGETISIVPVNKKLSNSIEFATYANMMGAELGKLGYKPVKAGEKADLIVELGYDIEGSRKTFYNDNSLYYGASSFSFGFGYSSYYHPFYSRYYGHHPYYSNYSPYGYYYSPWSYSPYGYSSFYGNARSVTTYRRQLTMVISENNEGAKRIYEGTVRSNGRVGRLSRIIPYMIKALFSNFPGISGQGETVLIELDAPE